MYIVYLQGRTHKAGAQTALERLMRAKNMAPFKSVLVCDHSGWLSEQCERHNIPWFALNFPKSRSLQGRLYGNRQFAQRVASMLMQENIRPALVCANDYIENLLATALSRRLHIPQAVLVRSSGISRRDYEKYACKTADAIIGVTNDMQKRLQQWNGDSTVHLVHDALFEDEILHPVQLPATFQKTLLVIGSPAPQKGWGDFIEALLIGGFDDGTFQKIHFTGIPTSKNNLGLERFSNIEFEFLEWAHDFPELVRKFSFAVQPSHAEVTGMALMETIAAGVPVLSTRVGIAEQIINNGRFLCTPKSPESLASALGALPEAWHEASQLVRDGQAKIRECFTMKYPARKACNIFRKLIQSDNDIHKVNKHLS